MLTFAKEFLAHDIPVGAIDLDSSWQDGFETFEWNSERYPDPKAMVDEFHSMGMRVVCWIVSMVNTDASTYEYGVKHNYFIRDAFDAGNVTLHWWHGDGLLLDYTNPDAVTWWHGLMDKVLDLGIDGWKTDGTDPYIMEYLYPKTYNDSKITYREYADLYYGDFFDYTRQKNGNDRLIMSRPVDGRDPIWLQFSPRRVVFSGWVGDQDPTFHGLEEALKRYLLSAWTNYVGFGSDIGGYRGGHRTIEEFTRWFQLGAFSPLMENGGDNDHRPWDYSNETAVVYRQFVHAHMSLVPYLLTSGTDAYYGGHSILTPMAPHNSTEQKFMDLFKVDTYNYLLGPDILVAPIHQNVTVANVTFPVGSSWSSFWNHAETFNGGQQVMYDCPLDTFPVFQRVGSILPMNITRDYVGFGDRSSSDALSLVMNRPAVRRGADAYTTVKKDIHMFEHTGLTVQYSTHTDQSIVVTSTAYDRHNLIYVIQGVRPVNHADTASLYAIQYMHIPHITDSAKVSNDVHSILNPLADTELSDNDDVLSVRLESFQSLEDLAGNGFGFYFDHIKNELYVRPAKPASGVVLRLFNIEEAL
jgi:alpha-glucosidase (family GH31 glycosyl hydrolase)